MSLEHGGVSITGVSMAFENFLLFSHVIQASIWPPEFSECFSACELMGPHLLCSEENKQARAVVG